MTNSKPLALVTGASSGIGAAFARQLANQGYDLIVIGRRRVRLEALAAEFTDHNIHVVVADLSTDDGIQSITDLCDLKAVSLLVNNAGVAHYMGFTTLPTDKAAELLHVKVVAPTLLARAVVPSMVARGHGAIINVAGMLAFGASAPLGPMPGRAVYAASLAHIVAFSQALHEELKDKGLKVQALCPGIVATEFHERQGMDLSMVPRMSAEDVVTASLRSLELSEVICAPGVEQTEVLDAAFKAYLTAFGAQSPLLAERYRSSEQSGNDLGI